MADSSSHTSLADLPQAAPLLAGRARMAWLAALVFLCAVVPLLNLVVPEGSVLHISDFMVALVGKIMCYAICALAMDLIWGYTGILSLGHGLFFAIGFDWFAESIGVCFSQNFFHVVAKFIYPARPNWA